MHVKIWQHHDDPEGCMFITTEKPHSPDGGIVLLATKEGDPPQVLTPPVKPVHEAFLEIMLRAEGTCPVEATEAIRAFLLACKRKRMS